MSKKELAKQEEERGKDIDLVMLNHSSYHLAGKLRLFLF